VLCVVCARRVRGVMVAQCVVAGAVRDALRACGLACFMLRASVRCGVRGLLVCAVLGDTRYDAGVPL
jgi:hypothetical protein